jgi:hypothetical protein
MNNHNRLMVEDFGLQSAQGQSHSVQILPVSKTHAVILSSPFPPQTGVVANTAILQNNFKVILP